MIANKHASFEDVNVDTSPISEGYIRLSFEPQEGKHVRLLCQVEADSEDQEDIII